ncbi:MAG: hypothetical protein EKK29_16420 [Hyphomicrobiales bacterium]|nr:MAG: hypothetical protein EKK29_16420 [Hyphomicrobiales bacterium]
MKNPPAFAVDRLDLKETIPARRDAMARLNHTLARVRAARAGFDDLEQRAADLDRRAQALESEISTAGGAALAARALGVGGEEFPAEDADIAERRVEIEKTRDELRRTRAALAAAPALFPPLLAELDEAKNAAFDAQLHVGKLASEWVENARRLAAEIVKDADFIFARLVSRPPLALPLPETFSALSRADLDALASEQAARDAAASERRPLVPEEQTDASTLDAWRDLQRRNESRNIEARDEWERARRAGG